MPDAILRLSVYFAIGLVWGLYWFFNGLLLYREYRILFDTPEESIRGIQMGIVHIHGTTKNGQLVWGPLTGTRCLFYQVVIEKRYESGALK